MAMGCFKMNPFNHTLMLIVFLEFTANGGIYTMNGTALSQTWHGCNFESMRAKFILDVLIKLFY